MPRRSAPPRLPAAARARIGAENVQSEAATRVPLRKSKPNPVVRRKTAGHPAPVTPPPQGPADVRYDFRAGLQNAPVECISPVPCAVRGTLPQEVYGTLYRNGPAQFNIHGERVNHWFDGDGKVIALRLSENGATYQSRFVDTAHRQKERHFGKRLYGGLGGVPRGGLLGSLRGWLGKNVGNTNVVHAGDKLLALYEGGLPYELDPVTLETLGEQNPGNLFRPGQAASAHPRLHAGTGDTWSFKMNYGPQSAVQLYRTAADGHVSAGGSFKLPYLTMVHDFCLTDTQAVFVLSPFLVSLPRLALFAMGIKPMYALPKLTPQAGSYLVTVPLAGDNPVPRVAHFDTTVMVLHTVNAWEEGGDVTIDVCDFGPTHALDLPVAMMRDGALDRVMPYLRRLRLDSAGKIHTELLGDAQLEFPQVAPHVAQGRHTKVYGVQWPEGNDYVGVPAVCDLSTGAVTQVPLPTGCYASECVVVSKDGAQKEDDVYLLTVVLDSRSQSSVLHVYDGASLQTGPVATVTLPQLVPHSFHGSFVSARK